jgi:hypothetical protein
MSPVETSRSGAVWHRRSIVLFAAGLAIVAVGGAAYWSVQDPATGSRPPVRASVPVSIAVATRQDRC